MTANSNSRRDFLKTSATFVGSSALAAGIAGLALPTPARSATTLRFWTWLDPNDTNPRAQVQAELVNRFQEQTGIEVRTEVVDWRTMSQQLLRAVAAGEGPDVTRTYTSWIGEQAAAGTLLPLDPFMEQWSQEKRDDIAPPLPIFGGETLAMYIENRIWLLYHRTDYLKEVGLGVPRTFDEVSKAASAIANDKRAGLIWTASLRSTDTYQYALPMIWALGGRVVNEDKSAAFHQGGGLAFMEWLRDLILEYKAMPPTYINWDEEQLQQAVNAGTTGMCFMGTNRLVSTRARLAADDAMVLQAAPAPSKDGSPPPIPVSGWSVSITRSSKNPEAAFQLLDFLTNTEAQVLNAKKAGETPVRLSALQDPWFDSPGAAEMRGWVKYVADNARVANSLKLTKGRELSALYNTATQEIILKNRPVKEALEKAAAKWNETKA
jgi:multiple sugar transport system substrate-binding protein